MGMGMGLGSRAWDDLLIQCDLEMADAARRMHTENAHWVLGLEDWRKEKEFIMGEVKHNEIVGKLSSCIHAHPLPAPTGSLSIRLGAREIFVLPDRHHVTCEDIERLCSIVRELGRQEGRECAFNGQGA